MLFFSYSRGNLLVVRSIAAELRRMGYRTWLDLESLRPGERWREAIDRAMVASMAMVYCISRLSLESSWTSVELRAAQKRRLPVVPLMVDDVPIEQLPPALRELHLIATKGWAPHETPLRAAQAIAGSVGRPPAPASWSTEDETAALGVEVRQAASGDVMLGWSSAHWHAHPAPLVADALSELARAADEARAAELHVGPGVEPTAVALVLGTLASRLGPARVRLHTDAQTALTLARVARCVSAEVTAPTSSS